MFKGLTLSIFIIAVGMLGVPILFVQLFGT